MNLANNIKAVANEHGKTISQLAEEMGVAQSHLSRTINNERISLKDLESLSEKIGCQIGDFFSIGSDNNKTVCPHCGKPISIKIDK
ncbi:MAG: helix-turn-helix transcriptional regulator [Prevotella sp.]|nr:helix-turn-helix transcriptional regulator [Prevotella sp.]